MTDQSAPPPEPPPPPDSTPPPPSSGAWPPPTEPPATWQGPPQEPGPAPGVAFAPPGPRLIAYIIDALIVTFVVIAVITLLAIVVFGGSWLTGLTSADFRNGNLSPAAAATVGVFVLACFAIVILAFAYFPFFWARSGQTPGMRPFNLYVVRDADGGKISGGQAILRLFGYWVSGAVFYLGFIWVLIDQRRRGWHDLIAGTVVIERPPSN
jgi:uncharacterized RDD family membrane protein YckC